MSQMESGTNGLTKRIERPGLSWGIARYRCCAGLLMRKPFGCCMTQGCSHSRVRGVIATACCGALGAALGVVLMLLGALFYSTEFPSSATLIVGLVVGCTGGLLAGAIWGMRGIKLLIEAIVNA